MAKHRFSGWPGAYCLDCGSPDPGEEALGHDCLEFWCAICLEPWPQTPFDSDGHEHQIREKSCGQHGSEECPVTS